jgi:hypothetical protein
MEHNIIVINSNGQIGVSGDLGRPFNSKTLTFLRNEISGFNLRATRIYMNEADYRDILEWGKENGT